MKSSYENSKSLVNLLLNYFNITTDARPSCLPLDTRRETRQTRPRRTEGNRKRRENENLPPPQRYGPDTNGYSHSRRFHFRRGEIGRRPYPTCPTANHINGQTLFSFSLSPLTSRTVPEDPKYPRLKQPKREGRNLDTTNIKWTTRRRCHYHQSLRHV